MAFIDEIKIYAEAGRGGDGVVRWRQEKFIPKGDRPEGMADGVGIFMRKLCVIFIYFQNTKRKSFSAERGEDGGKKSLHGKKWR